MSVDQASLNDLTDIITGTTEGTRLVLRGRSSSTARPPPEITVIDVLPTTASGAAVAPPAGMPPSSPATPGESRSPWPGSPPPPAPPPSHSSKARASRSTPTAVSSPVSRPSPGPTGASSPTTTAPLPCPSPST
ncbi:hypothetical protein [Actinomyces denticolens]|uniref:hypothetical protein n=1 Tax=Actinomyces denticolens TaxID=52767 RepID=UPI001178048D|nr:hypothetical protein [Actinomyces denticolens]